MQRVLVLSVGGSHEPIVKSIQHNKPTFIYFLCSDDIGSSKGSYTQVDGEGLVLKSGHDLDNPDLPNIVTQARITKTQYSILKISAIDVLEECHSVAAKAIQNAHKRLKHAKVIVDYTGGTKSMTAGLVAAALDDGRCELAIVTGKRKDLIKVSSHTSLVRSVSTSELQLRRRIKTAEEMLERFDYAAATEILESASDLCDSEGSFQKVTQSVSLCRGFDAWDRFDHATAEATLATLPKGCCDNHKAFLAIMQKGKGHGFEMVEDLLLNASRRAAQSRFDDAAARLYRALEMTAQVWLSLKYRIDSGCVDLDRVPESTKKELKKDSSSGAEVKIGLIQGWDLISQMPDDELGLRYLQIRKKLLSFLSVRNDSLLAHGIVPVTEARYKKHATVVTSFIKDSIEVSVRILVKRRIVVLEQFPTSFD